MQLILSGWNGLIGMSEAWDTRAMLLRMVLALLVGVVIGIDRGLKRRGAGIKTHVLVCLGAALVMMTSQYMCLNFEAKADLARMGAQVISGVGFLGVGTIMVTGKNQVRGLTTAAGLWACACVGLAIGIGFVEGALITLALIVITLKLLSKIDAYLHRYARAFDIYMEFDTNKSISTFVEWLHTQGIKIGAMDISKSRIKGEGPTAIVSLEIKTPHGRPALLDEVRTMEYVRYVEEL